MEYALNERKSSRRENAENLHSILGEAMNRDHTEQDLFQSGLGCTLASPFEDMLAVKKQCCRTFPATHRAVYEFAE